MASRSQVGVWFGSWCEFARSPLGRRALPGGESEVFERDCSQACPFCGAGLQGLGEFGWLATCVCRPAFVSFWGFRLPPGSRLALLSISPPMHPCLHSSSARYLLCLCNHAIGPMLLASVGDRQRILPAGAPVALACSWNNTWPLEKRLFFLLRAYCTTRRRRGSGLPPTTAARVALFPCFACLLCGGAS